MAKANIGTQIIDALKSATGRVGRVTEILDAEGNVVLRIKTLRVTETVAGTKGSPKGGKKAKPAKAAKAAPVKAPAKKVPAKAPAKAVPAKAPVPSKNVPQHKPGRPKNAETADKPKRGPGRPPAEKKLTLKPRTLLETLASAGGPGTAVTRDQLDNALKGIPHEMVSAVLKTVIKSEAVKRTKGGFALTEGIRGVRANLYPIKHAGRAKKEEKPELVKVEKTVEAPVEPVATEPVAETVPVPAVAVAGS